MTNTYAIGIMSGTSVDAIDAALIETTDPSHPQLIETHSTQFPAEIRKQIIALTQPGDNEIDRAGHLHIQLGEHYATIANHLIESHKDKTINVIGCHGQTIRHRPDSQYPFTLQIGSGAVIAARTGITTVTDFRSADMAHGGQGAPFAPFFHHALFTHETKTRAIINLGGIANITLLPANANHPITGFDSGPANGLMDAWIEQHQQKPYDHNGEWARSGKLNQTLLKQLLSEPYFNLPAPKSTGRELFNKDWLQQHLTQFDQPLLPQDIQRTLAELTAQSIANELPGSIEEVYLCGGGANNPLLTSLITETSNCPVGITDDLGFPSAWIECAAFAWMAQATCNKTPSTHPSVTGATRSAVTGAIYYP